MERNWRQDPARTWPGWPWPSRRRLSRRVDAELKVQAF